MKSDTDEMVEKYPRNEKESDFYSEEEIESLLEDDEISTEEEAFMRGYMDS